MRRKKNRDVEWVLNTTQGRSVAPIQLNENIMNSFMEASYQGPPRRTKAALIVYLTNRNPRKYRRLVKNLEWAKRELERIDFNPEDARFLI